MANFNLSGDGRLKKAVAMYRQSKTTQFRLGSWAFLAAPIGLFKLIFYFLGPPFYTGNNTPPPLGKTILWGRFS